MQVDNRFIDDLARAAAGAAGALAGMRTEVEARFKERFERLFADLEMVNREEFDATHAMAAKARAEQESITQRLTAMETRMAALEGRLATLETKPPARTRSKPKPAAKAKAKPKRPAKRRT
jgi:BMFP domain-containing protein YqiC